MTTRHSGPNGGFSLISPGGGGVVNSLARIEALTHLVRLGVEGVDSQIRADDQ